MAGSENHERSQAEKLRTYLPNGRAPGAGVLRQDDADSCVRKGQGAAGFCGRIAAQWSQQSEPQRQGRPATRAGLF